MKPHVSSSVGCSPPERSIRTVLPTSSSPTTTSLYSAMFGDKICFFSDPFFAPLFKNVTTLCYFCTIGRLCVFNVGIDDCFPPTVL